MDNTNHDAQHASAYKSKQGTDLTQNTYTITQLNEYSNYVHLQPEWQSYPKNLIVDVSTSWQRQVVPGEKQEPEISKHGAKQRQNTLQHINGKPVVMVQYDYRDCQSQWFHYVKTGLDFFVDGVKLLLGHNTTILNTTYPDQLQKVKVRDGFAQFVPICTSKDVTSYDYVILINDDTVGFDAYFVNSQRHQHNYFASGGQWFEHYTADGCFAHNLQKFSGRCNGIGSNGGLLIVVPDELSRPVTKITVKLTEITA